MKEATYRVHVLSEDMPVPPKNVIPRFYTSAIRQHSFIIDGVEDMPVEVKRGIKIFREDLKSQQEEADGFIVHIRSHCQRCFG